jgi:hypothetical protein
VPRPPSANDSGDDDEDKDALADMTVRCDNDSSVNSKRLIESIEEEFFNNDEEATFSEEKSSEIKDHGQQIMIKWLLGTGASNLASTVCLSPDKAREVSDEMILIKVVRNLDATGGCLLNHHCICIAKII